MGHTIVSLPWQMLVLGALSSLLENFARILNTRTFLSFCFLSSGALRAYYMTNNPYTGLHIRFGTLAAATKTKSKAGQNHP